MKNERDTNGNCELIYETDGMCTVFEAVVTASSDDGKSPYVVLDRTAFFPGGGGQQYDTGIIEAGSITTEVEKVEITDGEVRHYVKDPIPEGTAVTGKLNAKVRYARMQNHGSEHLISGLIKSLYGYENVGFHMTDEEVVIDTGGPLTYEQLRIVEEKANEAVFENVAFSISFPTAEEARNIDFRSKIDGLENVRLVTVEGYDACACCAPHVYSTGQLGVIKIVSATPHRGGMRLIVTAGMDAYRDYVMLHEDNAKIMKDLSSPRNRTAEYVAELSGRLTSVKAENTELKKELSRMLTESVTKKLKGEGGYSAEPFVIFTQALDPVGLRNLVNECTASSDRIICAFLGDDENGYRYIFAVNEKVSESAGLKGLADDFCEKLSAKGGGSAVMVQGSVSSGRRDIEEFFAKVRKKA